MALWDDLLSEIYTLTARPDLSAESALALRAAVRTAHKSGKYWRDLTTVQVSGLDTSVAIQSIDLSTYCPRLRQVIYLKSGSTDKEYKVVDIDNLTDEDGMYRTDVYWGLGTSMNIRAKAAESSYEICYYRYPIVSPTSAFDSWIADEHRDLLTLWAASTVLATVGESEIKARLDQLAAIAFADLQQDNISFKGN